jgi:hypothetical protein
LLFLQQQLQLLKMLLPSLLQLPLALQLLLPLLWHLLELHIPCPSHPMPLLLILRLPLRLPCPLQRLLAFCHACLRTS